MNLPIRSGEMETILVNGKSYPGLDANQSQTPEPWSVPNPSLETSCGPEIIHVEPGKTYRIRAIGGQALSLVSFAIEDHDNVSVIAADAGYVQPTETDHIQIGSGQRFDFLLRTMSESELRRSGKSNFWIQLDTRLRPVNVTSYALLSYNTSLNIDHTVPTSPPTQPPLNITNEVQDWLEYALQPLQPNDFPTAAEVSRQVVLTSAQLLANNYLYWSANNRTWAESNEHLDDTPYNTTTPSVGIPYLGQRLPKRRGRYPRLSTQQSSSTAAGTRKLNVYAAKAGEVIDIILVNEPNGLFGGFDAHPWHIHGGHVYDLGSGPRYIQRHCKRRKTEGLQPRS